MFDNFKKNFKQGSKRLGKLAWRATKATAKFAWHGAKHLTKRAVTNYRINRDRHKVGQLVKNQHSLDRTNRLNQQDRLHDQLKDDVGVQKPHYNPLQQSILNQYKQVHQTYHPKFMNIMNEMHNFRQSFNSEDRFDNYQNMGNENDAFSAVPQARGVSLKHSPNPEDRGADANGIPEPEYYRANSLTRQIASLTKGTPLEQDGMTLRKNMQIYAKDSEAMGNQIGSAPAKASVKQSLSHLPVKTLSKYSLDRMNVKNSYTDLANDFGHTYLTKANSLNNPSRMHQAAEEAAQEPDTPEQLQEIDEQDNQELANQPDPAQQISFHDHPLVAKANKDFDEDIQHYNQEGREWQLYGRDKNGKAIRTLATHGTNGYSVSSLALARQCNKIMQNSTMASLRQWGTIQAKGLAHYKNISGEAAKHTYVETKDYHVRPLQPSSVHAFEAHAREVEHSHNPQNVVNYAKREHYDLPKQIKFDGSFKANSKKMIDDHAMLAKNAKNEDGLMHNHVQSQTVEEEYHEGTQGRVMSLATARRDYQIERATVKDGETPSKQLQATHKNLEQFASIDDKQAKSALIQKDGSNLTPVNKATADRSYARGKDTVTSLTNHDVEQAAVHHFNVTHGIQDNQPQQQAPQAPSDDGPEA